MIIQFGPFDRTAVNIQIAILPHLIVGIHSHWYSIFFWMQL